MISRDLAYTFDPSLIATDLGILPDDWQRDLMRSTSPRVLMLCARQTGKSETASIIALGEAISVPGSLVLLISPSQRQSAELFRRVMIYFHRLPSKPAILRES